jgi:hypothetical protein
VKEVLHKLYLSRTSNCDFNLVSQTHISEGVLCYERQYRRGATCEAGEFVTFVNTVVFTRDRGVMTRLWHSERRKNCTQYKLCLNFLTNVALLTFLQARVARRLVQIKYLNFFKISTFFFKFLAINLCFDEN